MNNAVESYKKYRNKCRLCLINSVILFTAQSINQNINDPKDTKSDNKKTRIVVFHVKLYRFMF